jgi:hypothetical protein
LLIEGLENMDRLGYEDCNELTGAVLVSGRFADWRLVLRTARRAVPLAHWQNERSYIVGIFTVVTLALADSRPDTAAVLQGAARSMARTWAAAQNTSEPQSSNRPRAGHVTAFRREANRRLSLALSDEDLQRHRQRGEAMDQDQAVVYALTEIDRALADPAFGQP